MLGKRGFLWAAVFVLAGCATHPPGSPFELVHRRALLPPAAPASGLTVQWFGAATLLLRDGDDAILVDAFLSRPRPLQTLFGVIGPDPGAAAGVLAHAGAGAIAAVFVAHAHHDHVLDASAVVREKGALLYGSESVLNVARGKGLRDADGRLRLLDAARSYAVAGFTVRAFPTPHSRTRFPLDGVDEPLSTPAHALAYSAGQNYSFLIKRGGRRMLVVPSAASTPGMFGKVRADLVFLGIGALGKETNSTICAYWEEAVLRRGATQVILVHWDNFLYPPGAGLRTFGAPLDDVPRSVEILARLGEADGVDLHFVAPYVATSLPAPRAIAAVAKLRDNSRLTLIRNRPC